MYYLYTPETSNSASLNFLNVSLSTGTRPKIPHPVLDLHIEV